MREYFPILLFLIVAIVFAASTIAMSTLIVPRRHNPTKDSAYECGVIPVGDARARFTVKFYLVAVLFILFDVEVIFLYPWAVTFREIGFTGFMAMVLFLVILTIGLLYEFKKKALEWD